LNGWLEGVIDWNATPGIDSTKVLRWTNAAGRSWRLIPGLENGILRTGPENPYYDRNPAQGRVFHVVFRRDANGSYLPEVSGFDFDGNFYGRLPETSTAPN